MTGCKICCSGTMYTDLYYKLICYPYGHGVPYMYTYKFDINGPGILLQDTVFITGVGKLIIRVTDMYGNTDSKIIECKSQPKVERSIKRITYTDWAQLKTEIENSNTYTHIIIDADEISVDDTSIIIPEGVLVDFNGKQIEWIPLVTSYTAAFIIRNDYSGLCNGKFTGNGLKNEDYWGGCCFVSIINGNFTTLKDLWFDSMPGFNITVGSYPSMWVQKPDYKAGVWRADNPAMPGYISDDGMISEENGWWTCTDFITSPTPENELYSVGQQSLYLPQYSRFYDIAFYNSEQELIEVRRWQQFFRTYKLPKNSAFVKMSIYQEQEPKVNNGADANCYLQMLGMLEDWENMPCPINTIIDNVKSINTSSGILSVTGLVNDLHISRLYTPSNGWKWTWCIDFEDGWNAMCGICVSDSVLGGVVSTHGAQGITYIGCVFGSTVTVRSQCTGCTFVNTYGSGITADSARGYIVRNYSNLTSSGTLTARAYLLKENNVGASDIINMAKKYN